MPLVTTSIFAGAALEALLNGGDQLGARLFTNNVIPTADSRAADFIEPDASTGYARGVINPGDWKIMPGVSGAPATASAPEVRFENLSGTFTAYGYFVTSKGNAVLWAERFDDGPQTLDARHGLVLTPTLQFGNMADEIDLEGVR